MTKRKGKAAEIAAAKAELRSLTKQESEAMPKPSKALRIVYEEGGDSLRKLSETYQDPALKAALLGNGLLEPWAGELDLMGSIRALQASIAEVQSGEMRQADAMLVAQASTLDTLFTVLVNKAMANSSAGYLNAAEAYMRLALKAQSQARSTWESLSKIKNPTAATFIRQANMANGPQQVNNGMEPTARLPDAVATVLDGITGRASAHGEIKNRPNELLGLDSHGMDSGTAAATVGSDTPMATMGKRHRAAN